MKPRKPRPIAAAIYLVIAALMVGSAFTVFWGSMYSSVMVGGALMVIIFSNIITETHHLTDGVVEVLIVAAMILTLFPQ